MKIVSVVLLAYVLAVGLVQCVVPSTLSDSNNWANELEKANKDFNLDDYTKNWLAECEKNNGSAVVDNIHESMTLLTDCITSRIHFTNISDEIKVASPKGVLDEVFAKYCNQVSEIKKCKDPVVTALKVCLSDQSIEDLYIFDGVLDEALDFMCYKGGERIAIFMSENGTDCFMHNVDNMAKCLNASLPELEAALTSMHKTNSSIFNDENCKLETKMKACVIDSLKRCSDPTPANVVEGLIDSMIKKTPCYKSGSIQFTSSASFLWIMTMLTTASRFMFMFNP